MAGVLQRCAASAEVYTGASFPSSWTVELDFAASRSVEVGGKTVRAGTLLSAVPVTVALHQEGSAVIHADLREGRWYLTKSR